MKSSTLAATAIAVLLIGSLFAGSAMAAESSATDLQEESEVGTNFEATFELTDLFSEFETWTFAAGTELENATWTITQYNQAGSEISRTETDGANATQAVDISDGTSTIEVRVTGTTPEVETFSYDPPDRFVVASFTQEREGGTDRDIGTHESHHYTTKSKEARQVIDRASETVEGSGADDAQSSLDSAVSAYESGNFENAIDLAERAENEASQSQLVRNVLIGAGIVIVLAILLGGGYKLYKSRQQDTSRLR